MKKYLIDKGIGIRCKNNLQKEIDSIFDEYHRIVINENEFENTYNIICNQVDELNNKNSRCKAETVYSYKNSYDRSITIGTDSFVRLTFLKFEEI